MHVLNEILNNVCSEVFLITIKLCYPLAQTLTLVDLAMVDGVLYI